MEKSYRVRAGFVFCMLSSVYLFILIYIYNIQILQQKFYLELACQQYRTTVTLKPPRGIIADRHGKPLTLNKDSLSAFLIPNKIHSAPAVESFLKKHFPEALPRLQTKKDTHFFYIKRNLNDDELKLINDSNLDDIYILKEPSRWYQYDCLGHIVGMTDIDNIGQFGIEYLFDKNLAGTPATIVLEKDARHGYYCMGKEISQQGTQPENIALTIDGDLQFLVTEELAQTVNSWHAKEALALILDPTTGDILAMAQYPHINPNDHRTIALELTKNKAVTETYELGSVMKPLCGLAALQEGVVTIDEPINCMNTTKALIDGFTISTWKAHDVIPFSQVIQYSNNIGIALVAKRLHHKLYTHYKLLGFGKKTGLNWPGEQRGSITPPKKWSRQSIISLSFGYEVSANLLQICLPFCMIANGGYWVTPRIIQNQKIKLSETPLYGPDIVNTLATILERTVTEGTARRTALTGFIVRAKTGTANLVIDGQYSREHNIYTCISIIEKGSYKRVIATFVNDIPNNYKLYSSAVAVPLSERITQQLIIHEKMVDS